MRLFLKSLVSRNNGYLFGPGTVPKGVDVFRDLQRFGYASHIQTIFDVGANIGQFATSALKSVPAAQLVCFEPVESSHAALKEALDGFSNVKTFRAAVGSEPGELRMTSSFRSVTNHLLLPGEEAPAGMQTEVVPVRTVTDVCKELQVKEIGLLKTDTEGFDIEVLRGAEEMLSAGKVFLVLVEVGFSDTDRGHTPFSAVRELLKDFDVVGFYEQGSDANFSALDRADALFIHRGIAASRLPIRWK